MGRNSPLAADEGRWTQINADKGLRLKDAGMGRLRSEAGAVDREDTAGMRRRGRKFALVACLVCASLGGAGCGPKGSAPILLFEGSGTSAEDVEALEVVLRANGFSYETANSWETNRMTPEAMTRYRLLIVPGGNFETIGNRLTAETAATIRGAVGGGMNYLGICAGAFFAGNSPFHGLNLTSGVRFEFYGAERRGIRKTAVAIAAADGGKLDQYWEDGPELSRWGDVVAKYPDGAPAVAEGTYGRGWVVLSGVHPEAPEKWRRGMSFGTTVDEDRSFAAQLIRAALNGERLKHF